ncbi:gephyrin [Biomphalaria pfeifferi]|uniref:molybdopterin molybdotransferase n=1 Tax=Biomphalaria pfeifferi TaxID=112525 RepID=A0AAD8EWF7_BIOPF|nr:gephyrin [Biomphalaria pfeifferi]
MADRDSPNINVGILTISDSCYNGSATDRSGENLKHLVETGKLIKGTVVTKDIIPDELDQIKAKLLHWSDHLKLDLILTTGGTGFAHRDVTPEATKAVLEKEAMGLTVAMLKGSLDITPMAMLTRLVCGSRGSTLIINLPGSTKGSSECFQIASVAIPHAVDLLRGHKYQVERTHSALQAEHNHSQPSAGCEMLEKNLDYHLLDSVSSKVSSVMKTTETYLHSLDSFLHDTSGQTTLTQDSSVSTLMWKALLSLPKEAMLSLVNSFSSLTEASSSSSASTPNQDPYLHSSELKSQQAVVSSSLLPVVHKTQSLPEFLTSKGQRPVHLNHSSQMLPSNIQVVRPQITSVSPSQNSHVGSHHLDNTFNSSRSNTIGMCPSNVASHPQDSSPEHCHRSEIDERSDNILAREIKPSVQSSLNHVVQVFLPSSSYPETEQSGQRDGSWQTNKEFDLLRSNTEYQKMELSTNESPSSYLQNYSNLREDVNLSVESLFNTNQTSETISNFESNVQKDHHSEHKPEASNANATNTVRSPSSQQLKTCKNKSIESTILMDSQLKSNKKIITEFRYCSPNNTQNSSWHKLKDPVSTSIKSAKIHYMKSKGELLYVPVGDSLRSFINEHPMVQGIYLHKGKREIKKQLAQLCRQYDSGDRMTSWRRGKEILERNRFDDFFELTEEGRKEQGEVLASRKRDQYVVNWYVWCPGHSNCRRKCGGFGMCLEKCKGMMHKQDRHNCSLMINMKLFLSDMSTWRVNIIGSHVPAGSRVNWVPPVLYSLQSSSGRMLDDLSSTEQAKTAQRNSSCKKTASQSCTSAGSDAANNLPPASLSLHKVCKGSTQTSKVSMTFPSKKRISKMLSNLKRRRLERQSSFKTATFRKGDNSVISNEQDNFQLEGLKPKIAWGTKDVGSEADRDHGTHSSMKHPVNSDFETIFENLTRHFGIDVSARKLSNYTTECEINKADTSAMPDSTGLVTSSLAVERSNNLKCSPILTHKYKLDVAQGLGLDQPYLNANTLSDILQQANGQDNFDFQGEMSSSINSGLNDSSKSLIELKSEYRMNWHSSNAVKQDISFLSDVFPLQTSSACSPQSNNLFECSDAPLNTYIKSESEAIASIVQSLCGASDFDTMQAIALHDPMVNPELTDTSQVSANNLTLLEALPSYQEATASLVHQLALPAHKLDHLDE